jgi:hypothetical protein
MIHRHHGQQRSEENEYCRAVFFPKRVFGFLWLLIQRVYVKQA